MAIYTCRRINNVYNRANNKEQPRLKPLPSKHKVMVSTPKRPLVML